MPAAHNIAVWEYLVSGVQMRCGLHDGGRCLRGVCRRQVQVDRGQPPLHSLPLPACHEPRGKPQPLRLPVRQGVHGPLGLVHRLPAGILYRLCLCQCAFPSPPPSYKRTALQTEIFPREEGGWCKTPRAGAVSQASGGKGEGKGLMMSF
jgi:hypothetical protein